MLLAISVYISFEAGAGVPVAPPRRLRPRLAPIGAIIAVIIIISIITIMIMIIIMSYMINVIRICMTTASIIDICMTNARPLRDRAYGLMRSHK